MITPEELDNYDNIIFCFGVGEENRFNTNCGLMEFDNILIKKKNSLYLCYDSVISRNCSENIIFDKFTRQSNNLYTNTKNNSSILLFPKNIPTSYKNNGINKIEIKYIYKTKFWSSFVNIIAYLFHNNKNIYIYNDVYFNTISFKGRTLSGKFFEFFPELLYVLNQFYIITKGEIKFLYKGYLNREHYKNIYNIHKELIDTSPTIDKEISLIYKNNLKSKPKSKSKSKSQSKSKSKSQSKSQSKSKSKSQSKSKTKSQSKSKTKSQSERIIIEEHICEFHNPQIISFPVISKTIIDTYVRNKVLINEYCIIEVPGDGSCLFHCLKSYINEPIDMRKTIVDYIKNFMNDEIQIYFPNTTPLKYIKNMRKKQTFGGNLEIVAFSQLYNLNVWIYDIDRKNSLLIENENSQNVIFLVFYKDIKHYDILSIL